MSDKDPADLLRDLMRKMGSIHYVLIDRKPVPEPDFLAWAIWYGKSDRIVKQERIGPYTVSTVFLGLDRNFLRKGLPILFETMIFPTVQLEYQTRCATWEQAEAMHEDAATAVRRMVNG